MKKIMFLLLLSSPCFAGTGTFSFGTGGGTITISSGTAVVASAGIVLDTSTYYVNVFANRPRWNITIGNGSSAANKALFVGCSYTTADSVSISSITIGGAPNALTLIGHVNDAGNGINSDLWYSTNPPTGSQQIEVNPVTPTPNAACIAIDFTGVIQATVYESSATVNNSGSPASVNLAITTANDWMVNSWVRTGAAVPTPTNGQTVLTAIDTVAGSPAGMSYAGPLSAGTFADSYTFATAGITYPTAAIKPSP